MFMIRTPLRVSLSGGGTDLPAYYEQAGDGVVVHAAINRYMYVTLNIKFDSNVRACYSKTEEVTSSAKLEHEIIRACLLHSEIMNGIEVHTCADVPAGTGLGSSSALAVGLLHGLHFFNNPKSQSCQVDRFDLAAHACEIEITYCRKPIGKQDQYIAALGGIRESRFFSGGRVSSHALPGTGELQDYLLLFRSGHTREVSGDVLLSRQSALMRNPHEFDLMSSIYKLALDFTAELKKRAMQACGQILDESWQLKRMITPGISNRRIDEKYREARDAGAWGGKLCGAGGGGFLLFMAPPEKHDDIRRALGLREEKILIDYEGTKLIARP